MYKAVAEAVSGLKVFADGKWLTCIGNKPVRVGDRIWTDGRCVYGFNKEAQSPMVIISPQRDEDWAIPIVINRHAYVYIKDGLQDVGEMPRGEKVYRSYAFISNNTKDRVYGANIDLSIIYNGFLAFNVKDNDIYIIAAKKSTLQIWKNNEIIQVIGINWGPVNKILRAFIEDENNWSLIVSINEDKIIDDDYTIIGYVTTKEIPTLYPFVQPLCRITRITDVTYSLSLFNAYGKIPMYNSRCYERSVTVDTIIGNSHVEEVPVEHQTLRNYDDKGLHNLKIPIHNGFYFTINSAWYWGDQFDVYSEPDEANISIFNPSGNLLLTSNCGFLPYVTACKVSSGKYLIGIQYARGGYVSKLPAGLYLVQNKDNYECLKKGDITNQKLEKMRGYKNWLKNFQHLEHP